jgi:hypothetical protein
MFRECASTLCYKNIGVFLLYDLSVAPHFRESYLVSVLVFVLHPLKLVVTIRKLLYMLYILVLTNHCPVEGAVTCMNPTVFQTSIFVLPTDFIKKKVKFST